MGFSNILHVKCKTSRVENNNFTRNLACNGFKYVYYMFLCGLSHDEFACRHIGGFGHLTWNQMTWYKHAGFRLMIFFPAQLHIYCINYTEPPPQKIGKKIISNIFLKSSNCFGHLTSKNCKTFAGSCISNVKVCWISQFYFIVNWIYLGFRLLVGGKKNKQLVPGLKTTAWREG